MFSKVSNLLVFEQLRGEKETSRRQHTYVRLFDFHSEDDPVRGLNKELGAMFYLSKIAIARAIMSADNWWRIHWLWIHLHASSLSWCVAWIDSLSGWEGRKLWYDFFQLSRRFAEMAFNWFTSFDDGKVGGAIIGKSFLSIFRRFNNYCITFRNCLKRGFGESLKTMSAFYISVFEKMRFL